jgi:hypothetical protein
VVLTSLRIDTLQIGGCNEPNSASGLDFTMVSNLSGCGRHENKPFLAV